MQAIYYFAYGSNLLQERLLDRLGRLVKYDEQIKYKQYRLNGYKLLFNCGNPMLSYRKNKEIYANIVEQPNCFVDGILYKFNSERMAKLDLYEGLYEKQFFLDGNDICFTYISTDPFYKMNGKPSFDYINTILQGAYEHKMWELYNDLVDYKNSMYSLKSNVYKKVII